MPQVEIPMAIGVVNRMVKVREELMRDPMSRLPMKMKCQHQLLVLMEIKTELEELNKPSRNNRNTAVTASANSVATTQITQMTQMKKL